MRHAMPASVLKVIRGVSWLPAQLIAWRVGNPLDRLLPGG